MHERPQLVQEENGDPNSRPSESEGNNSSLTRCPTQSSSLSDYSNLDRDLFNDLVQIVPLVQSLIVIKHS